jgi:hypothetical protein
LLSVPQAFAELIVLRLAFFTDEVDTEPTAVFAPCAEQELTPSLLEQFAPLNEEHSEPSATLQLPSENTVHSTFLPSTLQVTVLTAVALAAVAVAPLMSQAAGVQAALSIFLAAFLLEQQPGAASDTLDITRTKHSANALKTRIDFDIGFPFSLFCLLNSH